MTTASIKANRLHLDKANHLAFENDNCYAPMGRFQNKQLLDAMDAYAADAVTVVFRTREEYAKRDLATYKRRIAALAPHYTFGGFKTQVIRGHILEHNYIGTIYRTVPNGSDN